jgi:hypothetical protein
VVTLTSVSEVPCSLSTSLETYDTSSGVTHLYLSTGDIAANAGGILPVIPVANPGH